MSTDRREEALEVMQSEYSGVISQLQGLDYGEYGRIVIDTQTIDGGPFLDSEDEHLETGHLIGKSIAEELSEETDIETEHEVHVKKSHGDRYTDINETRQLEDRQFCRGTVIQLKETSEGWEIPYTSNTLGESSETALKGIAKYCRKLDNASVEDLL